VYPNVRICVTEGKEKGEEDRRSWRCLSVNPPLSWCIKVLFRGYCETDTLLVSRWAATGDGCTEQAGLAVMFYSCIRERRGSTVGLRKWPSSRHRQHMEAHRQATPRHFVLILIHSRIILGLFSRLGQGRFLPNYLQFFIHLSPLIEARCRRTTAATHQMTKFSSRQMEKGFDYFMTYKKLLFGASV